MAEEPKVRRWSVTLEHVRHVIGGWDQQDRRIMHTQCSRRFVLGEPSPVHEPARSRCPTCYA
jgi:hypothetical protein